MRPNFERLILINDDNFEFWLCHAGQPAWLGDKPARRTTSSEGLLRMASPPTKSNLELGIAVFLLLKSTLARSIALRFISLARESILFYPYLGLA
jgi:hypothetical protein